MDTRVQSHPFLCAERETNVAQTTDFRENLRYLFSQELTCLSPCPAPGELAEDRHFVGAAGYSTRRRNDITSYLSQGRREN